MVAISILGATGSIGQNTIDLVRRRDDLRVAALTGGRNIAQLARDAIDLRADLAVTAFDDCYDDLRAALAGTSVRAAAGRAAVIEAAGQGDWVMNAIIGAAGLEPSLAALRPGVTLALANKETLVAGGPLVMARAAQIGAQLIPVDSEHSAVFQALRGEDPARVARVTLTASGGAFRDWPIADLARATPEQAATHPTWDMGQRITIDSASMFNKALELIEARELFALRPDQIDALVHPQSLIHAVVSFVDGGMMAHMGAHDMRHAIGYALNFPDRAPLPVAPLDLAQVARLDFRAPDPARYPALRIAQDVMQIGGAAGAVFNAAKERALDHFIARRVGFLDMAHLVARALEALQQAGELATQINDLSEIVAADAAARAQVDTLIGYNGA